MYFEISQNLVEKCIQFRSIIICHRNNGLSLSLSLVAAIMRYRISRPAIKVPAKILYLISNQVSTGHRVSLNSFDRKRNFPRIWNNFKISFWNGSIWTRESNLQFNFIKIIN